MVEVKVSGVAVRVTLEYSGMCGTVAVLGGEPIDLQDGQQWIFSSTPPGWRQITPVAVCCPEHPGVELGLVKDGSVYKPEKMYFWRDGRAVEFKMPEQGNV